MAVLSIPIVRSTALPYGTALLAGEDAVVLYVGASETPIFDQLVAERKREGAGRG